MLLPNDDRRISSTEDVGHGLGRPSRRERLVREVAALVTDKASPTIVPSRGTCANPLRPRVWTPSRGRSSPSAGPCSHRWSGRGLRSPVASAARHSGQIGVKGLVSRLRGWSGGLDGLARARSSVDRAVSTVGSSPDECRSRLTSPCMGIRQDRSGALARVASPCVPISPWASVPGRRPHQPTGAPRPAPTSAGARPRSGGRPRRWCGPAGLPGGPAPR